MTLIVTDMMGMGLSDIRVQAIGPTERSGTTDARGQLQIAGMPAGTYRVRFSGSAVTEFEKEVVVRGGPNAEVDVTLRPAPPPVVVNVPAPAPPPPTPATPPVGPAGRAQAISIVSLIDSAFLQGPRREVVVSCSGNTRVMLIQTSQDQPTRLYENAEVTYFVLGGEGAVRLGGRETAVKQDSFIAVPRGVGHAITHAGRRPLVMMAQISGEPCEEAK